MVVPDSQTFKRQLTSDQVEQYAANIDIEMPIWDADSSRALRSAILPDYFQSLKTAGWHTSL